MATTAWCFSWRSVQLKPFDPGYRKERWRPRVTIHAVPPNHCVAPGNSSASQQHPFGYWWSSGVSLGHSSDNIFRLYSCIFISVSKCLIWNGNHFLTMFGETFAKARMIEGLTFGLETWFGCYLWILTVLMDGWVSICLLLSLLTTSPSRLLCCSLVWKERIGLLFG